MSDLSSEKSDKSSELRMSAVVEASSLLKSIAEPRPMGDNVKSAIGRAARRLGFAYSRTRDIWYAHARRIQAEEMDRIREEAARAEAAALRSHLLALRRNLATQDSDFHRPTIDALERALRGMGVEVGSMDI